MFINFVCQVIIFLYLLDGETSWIIVISCGVGLAIELWKLQKAAIFEVPSLHVIHVLSYIPAD
jgi:hypothetical protein